MFKKKNQSNIKSYYYRVRGNNSQDYYEVPYVGVDDVNIISDVINDFLSKNSVDVVVKNQPAYDKFLNKNMVLVGSYDQVLELDAGTYEKYKDKIELILSRNMCESIREFSPYNGTNILVNYVTSGCDFEVGNSSKPALCDDLKKKKLKTIYISYDKTFDKDLFKMIVFDLYGDFKVEPEIKFLPGVAVTIKIGNKVVTFDWRAYEMAMSLVNTYKKESDYSKKLQIKMEGYHE